MSERYLVLVEPAYELASREAQARMDSHGYCRGLREVAEEAGYRVLEHRLLSTAANPLNPPGVLLIEKATEANAVDRLPLACPLCKTVLTLFDGNYFCENDGL